MSSKDRDWCTAGWILVTFAVVVPCIGAIDKALDADGTRQFGVTVR